MHALKANDASVTELNLENSGCGLAEAFVLGALMKVRLILVLSLFFLLPPARRLTLSHLLSALRTPNDPPPHPLTPPR